MPEATEIERRNKAIFAFLILYAVRLYVGDLGTFAGLKTSSDAEVLNDAGRPIGVLYAVGNDAASVMGGNYPGGGITLGPAITFGYIAVRHMSGANE